MNLRDRVWRASWLASRALRSPTPSPQCEARTNAMFVATGVPAHEHYAPIGYVEQRWLNRIRHAPECQSLLSPPPTELTTIHRTSMRHAQHIVRNGLRVSSVDSSLSRTSPLLPPDAVLDSDAIRKHNALQLAHSHMGSSAVVVMRTPLPNDLQLQADSDASPREVWEHHHRVASVVFDGEEDYDGVVISDPQRPGTRILPAQYMAGIVDPILGTFTSVVNDCVPPNPPRRH